MRKGVKAWFDSFAGRVPVTVLKVSDTKGQGWLCPPSDPPLQLDVRINADRGGWYRGEVVQLSAIHVIPRDHYHIKRGSYGRKFYTTPYSWDAILGGDKFVPPPQLLLEGNTSDIGGSNAE